MISRQHLLLLISVLGTVPPFAPTAASETSPKTAHAAEFATHRGMATTLAVCNLPLTCGGQKPVRATRKKTWVRDDYEVDEHLLVFQGLEVQIHNLLSGPRTAENPSGKLDAADRQRLSVWSLKITDASWPVSRGFRVGTSRARVEQEFGVPGDRGVRSDADNEECVHYADGDYAGEGGDEYEKSEYHVDPAATHSVIFCFKDGRVASIEWQPWGQ